MLHAGEVIFAATLAKVKELMLFGDMNQIPFINRTETLEVNVHRIA